MSNYPDGMDWGAYDDYHDPKLQCGCHSSDSCDCWCEQYAGEGNQHLVGDCNSSNCRIFQCKECGVEVENDEDEPIVCKECIAERGCVCTNAERRLWVDCMQGHAYPSPSRYSVQAKDLYKHWTRSPFSADERRNKGLVVMGIRCTCCNLEVN